MKVSIIMTIKTITTTNVKTKYDLLKNPTSSKVDSITDSQQTIIVKAFALYEEENNDGEIKEVLAFIDDVTGNIYKTISDTFKVDFFDIIDMMYEGQYSEYETQAQKIAIQVHRGVSKKEREFLQCVFTDLI